MAEARGAPELVEQLLKRLRETGGLRDERVAQAFRRVPRHLFVEHFWPSGPAGPHSQEVIPHDPERPRPEHLERIYADEALLTRMVDGMGTSSSSQPGIMVEMLQRLALEPGMRVLEIGAGTGFNAALMAELVRPDGVSGRGAQDARDARATRVVQDGVVPRVVTLDIQEDVVAQAQRGLARLGVADVLAMSRDGFEGAAEAAPYDRIVATVGVTDVSPRWAEQLAPGGFMLLPLRHADANPLVKVRVEDGVVLGEVVGFSGFMAVQGALADERYYRPVPAPGSAASADEAKPGTGKEVERPLPKELRTPGKAWLGFWFYVGVRDERAAMFQWAREFGLRDPETGATARIGPSGLVGDPELVRRLEALHAEWRKLGGPGMQEFRVRFVPNEVGTGVAHDRRERTEGAERSERAWALPGKFYRREFTLR